MGIIHLFVANIFYTYNNALIIKNKVKFIIITLTTINKVYIQLWKLFRSKGLKTHSISVINIIIKG